MAVVFGAVLFWKADTKRSFRTGGAGPTEAKAGDAITLEAMLEPAQAVAERPIEWSKALFQQQIDDAFRKNDPCAVMELMEKNTAAPPNEFWAAGMEVLLQQVRGKNALLEEVVASPDSPIYGRPKENATRTEIRFMNALLLSDQVKTFAEDPTESHRKSYRNLESAVTLFRELMHDDPENGAYAFFLGHALRASGAKKEEMESAFYQAAKAPRFETYYQNIFNSLQTLAYENVAMFTWTYSFLHLVPAPDFSPAVRALKSWAQDSDPARWTAHRLAKRMMDLGSKYKTQSPGYLYSRNEYVLGQNLKINMESKGPMDWEEFTKKMREAQEFISETPSAVSEAEVHLYMDQIEGKRDCRLDNWKALYAAYKAKG